MPTIDRDTYQSDVITHRGHTFRVDRVYDQDLGEPWKEHDGHGIVSDWTTRDKRPGERVLRSDRGSKRYYDFAETVKIALKDGWSTEKARQTPDLSKKQIAAMAVEADFEYLRGWCNGEWHWCGLIVTLLEEDEDGEDVEVAGMTESLWGMESNCEQYLQSTAKELAEQIIYRLEKQTSEEQKIAAMMAS